MSQRRRLDAGEPREKGVGVRWAVGRIGPKKRFDGVGQGLWSIGGRRVQRLVDALSGAMQGLHVVVAIERAASRETLVQHDSERE